MTTTFLNSQRHNTCSHTTDLFGKFMMNYSKLLMPAKRLLWLGVFFLGLIPAVFAGPGHDHGDEAPAAAGAASPRISSHSDLFELVGILDKGKLMIYLDRYQGNAPVTDAKIDVEMGSIKTVAAAQADGTYLVQNEVLTKPGTLAMSFTVSSGKDTDLLAGDLVIADPHGAHSHDEAAHEMPWPRIAGIGVGVFLLLGTAIWWMRRRSFARVKLAATAFVLSIGFSAAFAPDAAHAGPGHDHGDEAPAAGASNSPKRQNDGSVFMPKPSQRLLAVRTQTAEESSLPKTFELSGRIVADPGAAGKVQALQAGRIETVGAGLPTIGQTVRKGQVLANVRSSVAAIERANQNAAGLEAQTQLQLARKRLARLEQLEGSVPQRDIEAARSEVQVYTQRSRTIGGSANSVETLVAPISGVIAAANVVAGQVVDAREVLFEIVDSSRLLVEGMVFDSTLVGNIASAQLKNSDAKLRFSGAARSLRDGAMPVLFKMEGTANTAMSVNQAVQIVVQTREQIKGIALPAGALVKSASNQDMVWVHTGAEKFEQRVVRFEQLGGDRIVVLSGVKAGERVVTQAAALLNQVR
jgi:membrane fusion protein, heavy metal efflux system